MAAEVVYLIQGGEYFKIGRTKNLANRLKVIQTTHAWALKVVKTWECPHSVLVERYLHRRYSVVKMHGEWFALSAEDILTLQAIEVWPLDVISPQRPPKKGRLVEHTQQNPHQPEPAPAGSLQALLIERTEIRTPGDLRTKIGGGMSRQQAWMLWHGKTSLGLRTAKRIAQATGIPLEYLAEVDEAVPGKPRQRNATPPDTLKGS